MRMYYSRLRRLPSKFVLTQWLLWWLIPLLGLAVVLASSYAALTERRYSNANGVSGELLAGHSVGQSFVSRYDGLSGVELQVGTYGRGGKPSAASLALHLRLASATGPLGPDLATVRLPKGTVIEGGENPWHSFSFAPIQGSQDKTFYVELESPDGKPGEALTLYWWYSSGADKSNPYQDGTAYQDSKPLTGDLAFGLRYSPSPPGAWLQVAQAASRNLPLGVMLALSVALVLAVVWLALRLPVALREPLRLRRWLVRWSLPVALAVAAASGLLYSLLTPLWQGPDEYQHFAYVALLDKYNLDSSRVRNIGLVGQARDDPLLAAINASMDRANFSRLFPGYSTPGAPPDAGASIYYQLRQPPTYYWLGAAALRAARALGVHVAPYTDPEGALRLIRAVSVLISLGVIALAWLAGALLSGRDDKQPWLRLLLPLTIALLPMHAFIASVANNDVMAELAVSALFVALLALLRWPGGVRGALLAALCVALAVASSYTKLTALAAAVPLLALGLLVWVGMLVARAIDRRNDRRIKSMVSEAMRGRTAGGRRQTAGSGMRKGRAMSTMIAPFALAALVLLVGGGLVWLAPESQNTAAGWLVNSTPPQLAPRLASTSAHAGSYVVELAPPSHAVAWQQVVPPVNHPLLRLTFSGWVRLSPAVAGAGAGAGAGANKAYLTVNEGITQVAVGEVQLGQPGEWKAVATEARITASAEPVTVWLRSEAGGRPVQFDDLALQANGAQWHDPIYLVRLVNPSAETADVALRPLLARLIPSEVRSMIETVLNPQVFSKGALLMYYVDSQYKSFWGDFGWLAIPLPPVLYTLLGLVALLALAGLAWAGVRRWGHWLGVEWLGFVSLLALAAAVVVSWLQQMMLLATQGLAAYPQGRYLFVLMAPFAWLLITGVWSVYAPVARFVSRLVASRSARRREAANREPRLELAQPDHAGSEEPKKEETEAYTQNLSVWGAWLWVNALFLFASYCVLALIAPFYYG